MPMLSLALSISTCKSRSVRHPIPNPTYGVFSSIVHLVMAWLFIYTTALVLE